MQKSARRVEKGIRCMCVQRRQPTVRLWQNDAVGQRDYKNWFHSWGNPILCLNLHNIEWDIFWQQSDFFFWCNYSQQTLLIVIFFFFFKRVWVVGIYGPICLCACVGSFNMCAFDFLCVKKACHTRWFRHTHTHKKHKTRRLCASCLIILITLPSSDAQIPRSTNKHHSRINRQTSLKQHLPLTTSTHQLKGSHRRSMPIGSLLWSESQNTQRYVFSTGTNKNGERAKTLGSSPSRPEALIRDSGTDYCESTSSNAEAINRRSCNYLSSWTECMLHHQSGLTSEWAKTLRDWLTINLQLGENNTSLFLDRKLFLNHQEKQLSTRPVEIICFNSESDGVASNEKSSAS